MVVPQGVSSKETCKANERMSPFVTPVGASGIMEEFLHVKGIWHLEKVTMTPHPSPETTGRECVLAREGSSGASGAAGEAQGDSHRAGQVWRHSVLTALIPAVESQQALESHCKPQHPVPVGFPIKNHQCSVILGRIQFILRYILFLKKGILAACNRNVNQRVNLPIRPWPALPMLTQVSWDKKKKKRSKIQTVHLYTGCFNCCTCLG